MRSGVRAATGQSSIVGNMHMSTQHDVVGHDDSIADLAIMGNVAAGHQVAIAAQAGDAIFFFGCPIDGNRFAKDITIADDDLRRRALVTQILRFGADHHPREQMIVATENRITGEGDIVFQSRPATNFNVGTDDAMMANSNFIIEFRAGVNDGGMGDDSGHTNQLSRMDLSDMT